jgi:serine/threonine-protein kinase
MAERLETLGRYRILAELGRGIMGVVYRAHDPDLGRDVALKVIGPAFEATEEDAKGYEQRFFNEARAAALLSHPAIVVIHERGRDPASGTLFMALELLRGRTLQAILSERGPLPWRDALSLAEKVAEGLHHAHEHGIVHRDIKPANIMVLDSGQPKIMDFGIAKVDTAPLTAAGQLFGTPLYMSPEQALGRPADARSDLFSLGSVLYEMVTGRRAFAADSVPGIMLQVAQTDPPPASSIVPGVPEDADYALARCLAKDPARRYQDGRALAEDLRDICHGTRPRSRPAGRPRTSGAATIVSSRMPLPPGQGATPSGPAGALERPAPGGVRGSKAKLLLAAALVAAAAVVGYLAMGGLGKGRATPSAAAPGPAEPAQAVAPATPEASAQPGSQAEGSVDRALDRVASLLVGQKPAHLVIDLEHTLKSGTLRVWVDEKSVLEEGLDSRVTKRFAGIDLRKGRRQDSLEVSPGRHEVKVQVAWDDNVKTESIWANFKPGTERRLEARLRGVGGLRDLALHWR